jgi:uncharacterized membrane protein
MNWFLIALIPPFLYSVSNHVDKFLISKYFKGGGNGAVLIFSSLIGVLVFPAIYLFNPAVFSINFKNALLLIVNGFLSALILLPYLHALEKDEASVVVPLFQTIPVFSYILAYFVLGETLTLLQILASLLVLLGAIFLSLDISDKKAKFKGEVFWLMLSASFLYALTSLIFKFIAIKGDYWTTLFWEYVGLGIVGILLFSFIRPYRKQFLSAVKINKIPILGLNMFNEVIYVLAILALRFASLLAPLALVWVVNGFQPFFVFIFGIILTIFFPRFGTESIVKRHLFQKITAIIIMFIGTLLLNS